MGRDSSGTGLSVVAALALGLGAVHVFTGTVETLAATGTAPLVLAVGRALLGLLLLPAGVGVALRRTWGRWVGVTAFVGIAVLQILPLLAGSTLAVPLAGTFLATGASLYLLLAGEAFGADDDGRALTEDTNPHEFVR
ncbi:MULTISPECIES: hypothetical protein [Haloarcula]|uniref:hypothetical protein n=1 Tax=Haloarcula TaxID=2237 RepID=UPI0023EB0D29|nr:hypothetical protein [Halomicroarcula sp. XH51]